MGSSARKRVSRRWAGAPRQHARTDEVEEWERNDMLKVRLEGHLLALPLEGALVATVARCLANLGSLHPQQHRPIRLGHEADDDGERGRAPYGRQIVTPGLANLHAKKTSHDWPQDGSQEPCVGEHWKDKGALTGIDDVGDAPPGVAQRGASKEASKEAEDDTGLDVLCEARADFKEDKEKQCDRIHWVPPANLGEGWGGAAKR